MSTFLNLERDGPLVVLTMNNPQLKNILTGNTAVAEFVDACAWITTDQSIKAVILTGAGDVFSAGGNLKEMQRQMSDAVSSLEIGEEYRQGIQRIPMALYNLDVPVIAAVNGGAIGAGCDLACMCDIRIASSKAYFAESFIKLGLIPGDGGAWFLPRAVGMSKASEMAFTGESVNAAEALACGLVSRVVEPDQLLVEARALAAKITANPGSTLRMTKRLLREGQRASLASLLEMSAGLQAQAHKTPAHREAVTAFLEKRKPVFDSSW